MKRLITVVAAAALPVSAAVVSAPAQAASGGVATAADSTPRARYAYLGRGGTLPLLELLEQGGDQLLFVESRYQIPVAAIVLPKVGPPTLHLRHLIGAAGVGSLPKLEQELGVGVGISVLRGEGIFDAAGDRDARYGVSVVIGR